VPWNSVVAWAEDLQHDLASARAATELPESPERRTIDQLLAGVRERNLT